jgi:DNA polymerase II small subunit/DNA polymerase delta subunit B
MYIADLFANGYRDVYSSIPHDESDMRQVMSELLAQLSVSPLAGDCLFCFVEIKEATGKLK